jgi:hypothetical protein
MKCVIGSTVRNVSNFLDYTFNNISIIAKNFADFQIVFFYDESIDDTLNKLQNFQKINPSKIDIIINSENMLQYRTHRIANGRNKILEFIENNHNNTNFFILLDSGDECTYKINNEILVKYLVRDDWDALFFNRYGLPCPNYDMWALQFDIFIQNCWSISEPIQMINIMRNTLENKLKDLKDDELLEIYSAFNGIGLYRFEKFIGIRYDGITQRYFSNEILESMIKNIKNNYNLDVVVNENQNENCEHIGFHFNAINKNNAKIRMSKDIIYKVFNPKVQIYISNNFSKYYMPFLFYRDILYHIFKKYCTDNIEYIYNIDNFDNNEGTILIMNIYCLTYTTDKDVFEIIKNTKGEVLLINTEFYKHHNINNIIKTINENNLKFYILEYNIINYNIFKENYKNINLCFAPLIYHSHLENYYKHKIHNNYINWNDKDIDVLFIGRLNERRNNILNKIKEKYNTHIVTGFTGKNENAEICSFYERSKIVINILYEDDNSIFDYYRNSFLISNKILIVAEKAKNINNEIEFYLNDVDNNLFTCNYDDFYSTVDNILTNYNEEQINEIKEKQYIWFKSMNDMDYFINFIKKNFWTKF